MQVGSSNHPVGKASGQIRHDEEQEEPCGGKDAASHRQLDVQGILGPYDTRATSDTMRARQKPNRRTERTNLRPAFRFI